MGARQSEAACGQASGGAKQGDTCDASAYQYTPKDDQCQVISLLDLCLEKYQFHRARYVATGHVEDYRLALAAEQDRQDLLKQQLEEGA